MQNNSRLCKVPSFLKYLFVKFEPSLWVMDLMVHYSLNFSQPSSAIITLD